MNCWEILGIPKTQDKEIIQNTYDNILHQLTADELASNYSTLREAYEEALNYTEETFELVPFNIEYEKDDNDSRVENIDLEYFNSKINELINNKKKRIILDNWNTLISIYYGEDKSPNTVEKCTVIKVLSQYYYLLPKSIIERLVTYFELLSLSFTDNDKETADLLSSILYKIKSVPNFSFHITNQLPDEKIDVFFKLRFRIYLYIMKNNVKEAINLTQQAFLLSRNDGDLLNLRMVLLIRNNLTLLSSKYLNFPELTSISSSAKRLKPKNLTSAVFSEFVLLTSHKKREGATEEFNEAIDKTYLPDDIKNLMHGYFYFDQMNYDRAFSYWQQLPNDYRHVVMPKLKKKRSYLSSDNAAMYSNENQKSGFHFSRINRMGPIIIVVVVIAILLINVIVSPLIFYSRFFLSGSEDSSTYSYSWDEGDNGEFDYEDPSYYDLEEGYATTEESFVYFYLKTDDKSMRQLFSNTRVAANQRDYFREKVLIEPTYPKSKMTDFNYLYDKTEEYGYCTAIEYNDTVILIIAWDENDKIAHVYGDGWGEMPADTFKQLSEEIKINPSTSMENFMLKFYLNNENREKELNEITPYFTEECYSLIKGRKDLKSGDDMLGASYSWSILLSGDECALIYNESDDLKLVLEFNSGGQLEHIYGDDWETLSDDDLEYAMDNSSYSSYYVDDHYVDEDNWQNNIPDQGI